MLIVLKSERCCVYCNGDSDGSRGGHQTNETSRTAEKRPYHQRDHGNEGAQTSERGQLQGQLSRRRRVVGGDGVLGWWQSNRRGHRDRDE